MLARMALSEKLNAAIVMDSFACVVAVLDLLSLPPQAAATRARGTTGADGTRRPRCVRMNAFLLGLRNRFDDCGRTDEGLILVSMTAGEASRDGEALGEGENQLGEDREEGDQQCSREDLHEVSLGEAVDDVATQPAPCDEGGEGRRGHHLHGRRAHPGQHDWEG